MTYRQVLLWRATDAGYTEDVAWIRNDLAKVGKVVRDEADVVWLVKELYGVQKVGADWHSGWRKFARVLDTIE